MRSIPPRDERLETRLSRDTDGTDWLDRTVGADVRLSVWTGCLFSTKRRTTESRWRMAPSLVLLFDRLERSGAADSNDSVVPRGRVDPTDGVRVVVVCRLSLSCSKRDSLCTREPVDDEGLVGVADGVVVLERICVPELTGDRVDGAVVDLDRFTELFVDCLPIRVPIRLRKRDNPCELEVLGEGAALGSGLVLEGLE
jgi:hypothetical protein